MKHSVSENSANFVVNIVKLNMIKKNPIRWHRVIQCRIADCSSKRKSFREAILETYDLRNDELSHQVRLRIQGAVSDVQTADA